jgi:hypothetical protein
VSPPLVTKSNAALPCDYVQPKSLKTVTQPTSAKVQYNPHLCFSPASSPHPTSTTTVTNGALQQRRLRVLQRPHPLPRRGRLRGGRLPRRAPQGLHLRRRLRAPPPRAGAGARRSAPGRLRGRHRGRLLPRVDAPLALPPPGSAARPCRRLLHGVRARRTGRGFRDHRIGDYSGWLRRRVEDARNWRGIRSCLAGAGLCWRLQKNRTLDEFVADKLSPVQVSYAFKFFSKIVYFSANNIQIRLLVKLFICMMAWSLIYPVLH